MQHTTEIAIYEAVLAMQEILSNLEAKVPSHKWPSSLSKVGTPLSNAEFNLSRIIAKQALSSLKETQ